MSLSPEDLYDQQILDEDISYSNNYVNEFTGVNGRGFPNKAQKANKAQNNRNTQQKDISNMIKCRILLKQNSKLNDKLLNYFHKNLGELNHCGIIFEWIVVYEEEVEFYEEQDIDKFPTMVLNGKNIAGMSGIIKQLNNIIDGPVNANGRKSGRNGAQKKNSRSSSKADNGDIKDYLMSQLRDDDGDEEESDGGFDVSKRMAAMNRARKTAGLHVGSSGTSNPEVHDRRRPRQKRVTFHNNDSDEDRTIQSNNRRQGGRPQVTNGGRNQHNNYDDEQVLSTNTMDLIKNMGDDTVEQDMMEKFWDNMEETDIGDDFEGPDIMDD